MILNLKAKRKIYSLELNLIVSDELELIEKDGVIEIRIISKLLQEKILKFCEAAGVSAKVCKEIHKISISTEKGKITAKINN